jgi:HAD superfamily hydrolase (TIGR01509 family)
MNRRIRSLFLARVAEIGIPVKPGLHRLLAVLEKHQIPTAIATSTDTKDAEFSLRTAGLWDRFSAVVTGDQVQRGKPEPEIYLEAASRLGADPRSCVALEDSSNGVLAANRAGMRTLMVPDTGHSPSNEALKAAYAVLPCLDAATELIAQWIRPRAGGSHAS